MAQLQSPETYVDGQQVTATRLNNQTNGATLLPGAITDQTNITANTVASGDSILLYDLSATALREANVSDVLGSNLPVTTSAITAGANSDLLITTNDGVIVTGQAYTSGDGLTVTVTSTAHILTVGQVILVTAAGTGYNGTFRVATVLTNSFTYVMTTAATAGSGTLSYTKKGLVKNTANKSIAGNLYVDGSVVIAGTTVQTGAVTATNLTATLTTASTAVTQISTDNSTKIATSAFVNAWSPIKAWVNFNGNGSTIGANLTINASFNVTNVVYNAQGDYTINFTNAISDANYALTGTSVSGTSGGGTPVVGLYAPTPQGTISLKSTTQVRIATVRDSSGGAQNCTNISVLILR